MPARSSSAAIRRGHRRLCRRAQPRPADGALGRFSSGLGVVDFMKRTSLLKCGPEALRALAPAATRLAEAEGLQAHGRSVTIRLNLCKARDHEAEQGGMHDSAKVDTSCLIGVTLDEASLGRGSPDQEHERAIAIYDLIERNHFALPDQDGGPYHAHLALVERRLVFEIRRPTAPPSSRIISR
jgi:hypothetical protein